MADMPSVAEVFYASPGNSAEQATPQAAEVSREAQMAEALYGEKSAPAASAQLAPAVQKMRAADPARRMFSPQLTYAEVLPDPENEPGRAPDPVMVGAVREMRELMADLGLPPTEVAALRDRSLAVRRAGTDQAGQQKASADALERRFGKEASATLKEARALVARDPRVGKLIESMGLGDDAETIITLAEAARRQKTRGQLKG